MLDKKNSAGKAARTVGFMAVIIFLAKLAGLLRETFIANLYGQGYNSDILNTATQIPLLFFDMTLGVAILSTFVPVFNKFLERDGKKRALEFASTFINVVTIITVLATLVGMIFSKHIVGLMVPGYGEEKILETAHLLQILFPSIIFTAIAYIMVGLLQSFGEFNIPSIISLVSNSVMIFYLVVFKNRFGLEGVIISMVISWALQLFVQLPALRKKGITYSLKLNLKDEGLREAACLALPVLISSWVQPLCAVINMSFGSGLGDGAVSGLNWANKIYIIMVGVFAYAVTNFIFPKLSRLGVKDGDEDFAKMTRTSLSWIIFIISFVASLFISLSKPIIKVVFERGEFTQSNTNLTATALFYYSFGMVAYAVCEILNKSFYALRDGKTPMFSSVFGVFVNFLGAFIFVKVFKMGVGGLALASAVSSVSIGVVLLVMINKRKKGIIDFSFVINLIKTLAMACLSAIVSGFVYGKIDGLLTGGMIITLLKLSVSSLAALIVYIGAGFLLRTQECMFVRRLKTDE